MTSTVESIQSRHKNVPSLVEQLPLSDLDPMMTTLPLRQLKRPSRRAHPP